MVTIDKEFIADKVVLAMTSINVSRLVPFITNIN